MHQKSDILELDCPAACEKLIPGDCTIHNNGLMVMPGTLQDRHKNLDPDKGIPPSRRKFNLIYMILEGFNDICLGTEIHRLKPGDLIIIPEYTLFASKSTANCTGYCIHFKTEFIQPNFAGLLSEHFPFFDMEAEHIFGLSLQESLVIQKAFRDILDEYGKFSHEKESLLKNLVYILLLRIREIYRSHSKITNPLTSRNVRLCNQFRHLVERNFLQIREVKLYAKMLNITPQYLSDVVKSTLGRSPRKLINEMLTRESRILLSATDKTLSEIAYMLRFDDQAHFSHFIKRQTGFTPTVLRKML
jgi:AraC-like DNA-binding protein